MHLYFLGFLPSMEETMKLYATLVGTDADPTATDMFTGSSAFIEIPFDQFIVSCYWAG